MINKVIIIKNTRIKKNIPDKVSLWTSSGFFIVGEVSWILNKEASWIHRDLDLVMYLLEKGDSLKTA